MLARDPARRRGLCANAALVVVSVLVALGLCELGMRVAGISFPHFERPDAVLGSALVPRAEGWFTKEGRSYVRINSAGFRDREHALARPDGSLRVAVLGDSYAEAMQVELEQTFFAVAERELASCGALEGRTPELLNFGVSGYGTAQELLTLRERALAYEPDFVLLAFFVGNDLRNNTKELQRGGRPYFVYRDGKLVLDTSFNDSLGQRLRTGPVGRRYYEALPHSRVLQLLRAAAELRRRAERLADIEKERRTAAESLRAGDEPGLDSQIYLPPREPVWELAWRLSEDLIRMLRDEVEARDARFLLVTLGNGIQVHPDPNVRARYASLLGVADLDLPDRRLRAFAEREGIDILTLTPALRERAQARGECLHGFENAIHCGGHWNERGHRAAGEEIAGALCRRLGSPPQAGSGGVRSSTSKASWRMWLRRISSRSSDSLT